MKHLPNLHLNHRTLPLFKFGTIAGLALCIVSLSAKFLAVHADEAPLLSADPAFAAPPPFQPAPQLAHGSGALVGDQVTLVARPLDSNRPVSAVRFMLDGVMLSEQGAPGRYQWDTRRLRAGRHVVQVQAFEHDRFVGLSEPTVVIVGQGAVAPSVINVLEVPFFTYETDPRRPSEIVAPKIAIHGGAFAETGSAGSARLGNLVVEVYLNGIKQTFAPAARIASAVELAKPQGKKLGNSAARSARPARRHSRSAARRAPLTLVAQPGGRTVWLPARPLLARLGARLTWLPNTGVLVADLNIAGAPRRILLATRGEKASQAEIGGHRVALGTPVRLAENALMVPLSFCTDALDLRVRWQKADRRVEMFTPIMPA